MDAVTEVLIDRTRETDRINGMVLMSLAAHGVLVAAVALMPRPASAPVDEGKVITISLAGAPGPIQGLNPMAPRPIQEVAPDPAKARTDTPPAAPKPEMVENVKTAKPEPKAPAKPEPKKTEPQLRGRTPTQGAEVKEGKARVDTQAALPFGTGLATGGGGTGGARTEFGDFCCPEYLQTVQRLIYGNSRPNQGQAGAVVMKFVINRDGTLSDVTVVEGNSQFLILASQRALALTQKVPPLPAPYHGNRLTVLLDFTYK